MRPCQRGCDGMMTLKRFIQSEESGATAIEYSLIAGAIALAIIVIVQSIGTKLKPTFTSVSNGLG